MQIRILHMVFLNIKHLTKREAKPRLTSGPYVHYTVQMLKYFGGTECVKKTP